MLREEQRKGRRFAPVYFRRAEALRFHQGAFAPSDLPGSTSRRRGSLACLAGLKPCPSTVASQRIDVIGWAAV
jgi:hypothetical protein